MPENIQIAIIGLLAAILGSLVTQGFQWWRERSDRKREDGITKRKMAIKIAHSLDQFTLDCASILVKNDFAGSEVGVYDCDFQIPEILKCLDDIDPSSLSAEQYSDFLALHTHRRIGEFQIDLASKVYDGEIALEETSRQLKRLGSIAQNLSKGIRSSQELALPNFDDEYMKISDEIKMLPMERS